MTIIMIDLCVDIELYNRPNTTSAIFVEHKVLFAQLHLVQCFSTFFCPGYMYAAPNAAPQLGITALDERCNLSKPVNE